MFIVGIILYKEVEIEYPAYPHEPGLEYDQEKGVYSHPPEEPVILRRQADEDPPYNKSSHGQTEGEKITYIPGAVPESWLQLKMLLAFRAFLRHFQGIP
jgi:hypothetical protein